MTARCAAAPRRAARRALSRAHCRRTCARCVHSSRALASRCATPKCSRRAARPPRQPRAAPSPHSPRRRRRSAHAHCLQNDAGPSAGRWPSGSGCCSCASACSRCSSASAPHAPTCTRTTPMSTRPPFSSTSRSRCSSWSDSSCSSWGPPLSSVCLCLSRRTLQQ